MILATIFAMMLIVGIIWMFLCVLGFFITLPFKVLGALFTAPFRTICILLIIIGLIELL